MATLQQLRDAATLAQTALDIYEKPDLIKQFLRNSTHDEVPAIVELINIDVSGERIRCSTKSFVKGAMTPMVYWFVCENDQIVLSSSAPW